MQILQILFIIYLFILFIFSSWDMGLVQLFASIDLAGEAIEKYVVYKYRRHIADTHAGIQTPFFIISLFFNYFSSLRVSDINFWANPFDENASVELADPAREK